MRHVQRFAIVVIAGLVLSGVSNAERSPSPVKSQIAAPIDDDVIQARARTLDARLDIEAAAKRLPKARIAALRTAIGRVQTEAGHQARVNGRLSATERKAFELQLDAIERQIPRG